MRPLAELTYYEILDLSRGATALEIRLAYKTALEMYSEDSTVIYSLFSGEERSQIFLPQTKKRVIISPGAEFFWGELLSL